MIFYRSSTPNFDQPSFWLRLMLRRNRDCVLTFLILETPPCPAPLLLTKKNPRKTHSKSVNTQKRPTNKEKPLLKKRIKNCVKLHFLWRPSKKFQWRCSAGRTESLLICCFFFNLTWPWWWWWLWLLLLSFFLFLPRFICSFLFLFFGWKAFRRFVLCAPMSTTKKMNHHRESGL